MKKISKLLSVILILSLTLSAFSGCGKKEVAKDSSPSTSTKTTDTNKKDEKASDDQELIEYTVFHTGSQIEPWIDLKGDLVTPAIEEKFNIKVKEVIMRGESSEKFNTLVAANAVPDVIIASQDRIPEIIGMGVTKDLTELVPEYMPNYWNNLISESDKPYHYTEGKIHTIFQYDTTRRVDDNLFADPYFNGTSHAILTREDLLEAAGYSFTSMADIQAACEAEGRAPTYEELQVSPAIETPEDLYAYMKKIDDLDIKVNGLDMIPLSIRWSVFHFGTMFNFGHWQWNAEQKKAEGFLGIDGAKEYYEYLHKMYQEGLLDKDFLIQKKEQLQQKVASGRVGVFFTDAGNVFDVRNQLKATDPNWELRPIPFPANDKHGVFDCYSPGWWSFAVNKDLDDDATKRILAMWDYMTTDEALDTVYWGPESEGLFKVEDGKRRYTDTAWEEAMVAKTAPVGGPQDSGLFNYEKAKSWSLIGNVTPVPNRFTNYPNQPEKSLTPKVNALAKGSQYTKLNQVGIDASSSYGNGEVVAKTSKFFWDEFRKSYLAKLMVAKTQEEFDAAWEETMNDFKRVTNYEQAVEDMTEWFINMGNE